MYMKTKASVHVLQKKLYIHLQLKDKLILYTETYDSYTPSSFFKKKL